MSEKTPEGLPRIIHPIGLFTKVSPVDHMYDTFAMRRKYPGSPPYPEHSLYLWGGPCAPGEEPATLLRKIAKEQAGIDVLVSPKPLLDEPVRDVKVNYRGDGQMAEFEYNYYMGIHTGGELLEESPDPSVEAIVWIPRHDLQAVADELVPSSQEFFQKIGYIAL